MRLPLERTVSAPIADLLRDKVAGRQLEPQRRDASTLDFDILILAIDSDERAAAQCISRLRRSAPALVIASVDPKSNPIVAERRALRVGADLVLLNGVGLILSDALEAACSQRRRLLQPPEQASGPRILVVDDDDDIVLPMTLEVFYRASLEVLGTPSGYDALKLLRQNRIAVLLTDLRMPELDGPELIRSALLYDPRLLVIVLSGYAESHTLTLPPAALSRVVDVLSKPTRPRALLAQVNAALQRWLDQVVPATESGETGE